MTDLGRAGVYAAAWAPATILAFIAEDRAITAFNSAFGARFPSWSVTLALNVIPALVGALLVFLPVAYFLHRMDVQGRPSVHLVRGSILYGLVVILGLLLLIGSRNSDFGLFAQFLLWPAVTAIAGILADLLVWGLWRRQSVRGLSNQRLKLAARVDY